jgi:hypothetical protein
MITITKPVAEGGCCRTDSTVMNVNESEVASIDLDLMMDVILGECSYTR